MNVFIVCIATEIWLQHVNLTAVWYTCLRLDTVASCCADSTERLELSKNSSIGHVSFITVHSIFNFSSRMLITSILRMSSELKVLKERRRETRVNLQALQTRNLVPYRLSMKRCVCGEHWAFPCSMRTKVEIRQTIVSWWKVKYLAKLSGSSHDFHWGPEAFSFVQLIQMIVISQSTRDDESNTPERRKKWTERIEALQMRSSVLTFWQDSVDVSDGNRSGWHTAQRT